MTCPRCQHENPVGAMFCDECGAHLEVACTACGELNRPGAKFCRKRGEPVIQADRGSRTNASRFTSPKRSTPKHLAEKILTSKSALEGERKQVTVLFADRDPEEARELLDPVLERRMEAVHRYEGTVNQVMGDGIMALFGAPLTHEDHAVRACYAAPWPNQPMVVGLALALAGVYSVSPIKRASQARCRELCALHGPPFNLTRSAVVAGVRYGLSCMGRSAALMVAMVLLGMFSLWWAVILGLVVLVYKFAPPLRMQYELALSAALVALGVAYVIGTR